MAGIEVGTGRRWFATAQDDALDALAGPAPEGTSVTDVAGHPLAAEELPLHAAREGRPYPETDLRIVHGDEVTEVVASVICSEPVAGAPRVALLVVAPKEDGEAATRERFVAIAAHELRSPIASLQLDLTRLKRRLAQTETVRGPDVADDMDRALRQVARLTTLVQNILDASRLDGAGIALALEEEDLCAIVTEMVDTLRLQARPTANEIILAPCEAVHGMWDRVRLEQVLNNLVANAIRYGGRGKPIRIAVTAEGGSARIEVRDHGPGIAPEDRRRIFEPFTRARATAPESSASHSLGLGLYVVREIVRAANGRVHVESPPDGGAKFVVELPIRAPSTSREDHGEEEARQGKDDEAHA